MLLTEDGVTINPETDPVFFYPDWGKDGIPCLGLPVFDNTTRKWTGYHGEPSGPLFATREGVDAYIQRRGSC